jgi:hypothetical protein
MYFLNIIIYIPLVASLTALIVVICYRYKIYFFKEASRVNDRRISNAEFDYIIKKLSGELRKIASGFAGRKTVVGVARKFGYGHIFDAGDNERHLYDMCREKYKTNCPVVFERSSKLISRWILRG